MSVPQEQFDALKTRVTALEGAIDALATQLDDDAKNNAGALTDSYAALGASGNDQYTVTNLKNHLVAFVDGSGVPHTLAAAGSSDEAATITGLTAAITQLETDGYVSVAAV